ncbi:MULTISPECIES: hypothetical protein [unclassified Pseudomonas]|uniref:hypothetical protein n=1 Tax=unclassified Pseudomonas TaxID=196821 RepID=UPI00026FD366|nr:MULTISPECIES: hypothetical protein [unclassified Pseudomonas]EJM00475.1 hypothetical protein PMI19_03660 [Pseudomonas sp. GM16]EJM35222.1 hypothetical protein PMI23_03478 [Pseudomonas sp. GM24]
MDFEFTYTRLARTEASESYVVWLRENGSDSKDRLGFLELHFERRVAHGTLIIERELSSEVLGWIVSKIDDELVNYEREDFIVSVYLGEEVGYYSDVIGEEERSYQKATRGDLNEIHKTISKVIGRQQAAKGKLTEHAICSYFEKLGFQSEIADSHLDAAKVDVVATSTEEVLYVQSKAGVISSSEIRKVVSSVSKISESSDRVVSAVIIAREFPMDAEIRRRSLESEFGVNVMYIQLYQILAASPEYRRALGG